MKNYSQFSVLTHVHLHLIEQFCCLWDSEIAFDMQYQVHLFRLLQSAKATDAEIWLALCLTSCKAINDQTMNDCNPRAPEIHNFELFRYHYALSKNLLEDPRPVDIKSLPSTVIKVCACLIVSKITNIVEYLPHDGDRLLPLEPMNACVLYEVFLEYGPIVKETHLWELFKECFKTLAPSAMPKIYHRNENRGVYEIVFSGTNADWTLGKINQTLTQRIEQLARISGFETACFDRMLYIAAHAHDEEALEKFLATLVDDGVLKTRSPIWMVRRSAKQYTDLSWNYDRISFGICSGTNTELILRLIRREHALKTGKRRLCFQPENSSMIEEF